MKILDQLDMVLDVETTSSCPVNSHNEWDPLEEVIVGSLDDAMFPEWTLINEVTVPPGEWAEIEKRIGGKGIPYPKNIVKEIGRAHV